VTEFRHQNCAEKIEEDGDRQRRLVAANEPESGRRRTGEGGSDEVVPTSIVKDRSVLVDLSGRTATQF
jgi:hypothetical protein